MGDLTLRCRRHNGSANSSELCCGPKRFNFNLKRCAVNDNHSFHFSRDHQFRKGGALWVRENKLSNPLFSIRQPSQPFERLHCFVMGLRSSLAPPRFIADGSSTPPIFISFLSFFIRIIGRELSRFHQFAFLSLIHLAFGLSLLLRSFCRRNFSPSRCFFRFETTSAATVCRFGTREHLETECDDASEAKNKVP